MTTLPSWLTEEQKEALEAFESSAGVEDPFAQGQHLAILVRRLIEKGEKMEKVVEAARDVLAVRGKDFERSPLPAYMERPFGVLSDQIAALASLPDAKEPCDNSATCSHQHYAKEPCRECGGEMGKFIHKRLGGHPDWIPCPKCQPSGDERKEARP